MHLGKIALLLVLASNVALASDAEKEGRFLKNVKRITIGKEGEKAGEAYFSPDGKQIIFQAVKDGQPYYQIYVVGSEGGAPRLVSTGKGKTTCAYFHPTDKGRFLYASTHLDEKTHAPPKEPKPAGRGYKWDDDPAFDVFVAELATGKILERITSAPGYDAEASYSHDGKRVCFSSQRDGAQSIYVMDADGKNATRIGPPVEEKLSAGGPFFMPGDREVLYRAQGVGDGRAPMHAYVTSTDGKATRRLTRAPRMNWCPYPHPDGKKVVYAAALEGHRNFEVFLLKTDGSYREVRLTWSDGFDALPSFSPDGKKLVWTSTRAGGASDVFVADFVDPPEDAYEVQTDQPEAPPSHGTGGEHGKPGDKPKAPDPHSMGPKTSGVIRGSEGKGAPAVGADHIEELGLLNDVRWLADPEREGRRGGTFGEVQAARYVRSRFEELGVSPGGLDGQWEQSFEVLAGANLIHEKCHLDLGRKLELGKDWKPLLYSGSGEVEGELVFCGYGIESKEHEYDDYLTVDAKGKVAVIYTRGPASESGGAFGSKQPTLLEDIRFKVSLARHKGAAAVVFVKNEGEGWLELGYGDPTIPVLQVRREAFPWLEKTEALRKEIDAKRKPASAPLGAKARLSVGVEKVTARSRNVIGRIEGTSGSREVIVVGAHMDHLGHGGDGSLAPGAKAIHPGADDNASGVAGLLALARALHSYPPKRTVLLVAFGAEEMGLLGSAHFVKHSPVKLERVVAMLNMDMIGRLGKEPLVVGGAGTAKEWPQVLEKAARSAAIDIALSKDGFGPSDHASFYGKNIPVLFLFTRSHADYHKPSDTAEKIDGPGIERVARFGLAAVRAIDGLEARPTFEKAGADPHAQGGVVTGERGPWFGSVPDYSEGEDGGGEGVKITGTRPGSPAEKAGIKAGDRIVEFDGRAIKNLYDYTYAIRTAKTGKAVKVVVLRDGKRVELEATLVHR